MSGTALRYDFSAVERVSALVESLGTIDKRQLLDEVGAMVESQVRRRITEEKESPEGEPWPPWSERYGRTRRGNKSLLESEGDLVDSMGFAVAIDGSFVEIGTNLIYGATHQFGDPGRNIPARPYLGLSDVDQDEIEDLVDGFVGRMMSP